MPKYDRDENRRWQNSLPRKPLGASVIFFDEDGRVLVVKPNYRDGWNLPGGVVDEGESPLDAVVRECSEELGLTIDPGSLKLIAVNYTPPNDGFIDFLSIIFDGGVLSSELINGIKPQQEELDEVRFVAVEETARMLTGVKYQSVKAAASKQPGYFTANGVLQ